MSDVRLSSARDSVSTSVHLAFPWKKQVDELQHACRSSAIRAFDRPCKVPVAPWIPKRTLEIVQLKGRIRKFMHNVRKRSKTVLMSVAFYRWL